MLNPLSLSIRKPYISLFPGICTFILLQVMIWKEKFSLIGFTPHRYKSKIIEKPNTNLIKTNSPNSDNTNSSVVGECVQTKHLRSYPQQSVPLLCLPWSTKDQGFHISPHVPAVSYHSETVRRFEMRLKHPAFSLQVHQQHSMTINLQTKHANIHEYCLLQLPFGMISTEITRKHEKLFVHFWKSWLSTLFSALIFS